MTGEIYPNSGSSSSGVTTLLLVVAVIATVISAIGVFTSLSNFRGAGYAASGEGNVTLEIQKLIKINFTKNIINWSSGHVNDSCGAYATLDTNNTPGVICGVDWIPQTQGLILQSDATLNIAVNLTSDSNASTLLDTNGPHGSLFRWKIQEFNLADSFEDSCATPVNPATYTDIVIGQNVTICDDFRFADGEDELRIDFYLNISQDAPPAVGYRTAIITATAYIP